MQDILEVIRVMAALAWSDGVLDHAEGEALRRLIERAGLPDDARWQAMNFVEFETRLGEINLDALTESERRAMYRAAEQLAIIDGRKDPSEEKVLARLRAALHVRREDVGPLAPPPAGPGPVKVRVRVARPRKAAKKKRPARKPARRKTARKAPARRKPAGTRKKAARKAPGRKTAKAKAKRRPRRSK